MNPRLAHLLVSDVAKMPAPVLTCMGTTAAGTRCRRRTVPYCHEHAPRPNLEPPTYAAVAALLGAP